jgi:hypothetical protein
MYYPPLSLIHFFLNALSPSVISPWCFVLVLVLVQYGRSFVYNPRLPFWYSLPNGAGYNIPLTCHAETNTETATRALPYTWLLSVAAANAIPQIRVRT